MLKPSHGRNVSSRLPTCPTLVGHRTMKQQQTGNNDIQAHQNAHLAMLTGLRKRMDDGTVMSDADEFSAVRRRLPVGTRVRGRVSGWPAGAGRAGVSVDVGDPVRGWVDILWLPDDADRWPAVGQTGFFQVLQHRGHEIRLLPLDAGLRSERCKQLPWSGEEWAAITRRHPVGSTVEATVDDVFVSNREYTVRFGECWSAVSLTARHRPVVMWSLLWSQTCWSGLTASC